jgi:hypothetical protein
VKLREATYVQLRGVINIAGRSAGNLDARRDECVLHLHEETGGVFVTYAGSQHAQSGAVSGAASDTPATSHYLPAMAVESVDLVEVVGEAQEQAQNARKPQPAPQSATLADDVLAEFGQGEDAKPNPRRKPARK